MDICKKIRYGLGKIVVYLMFIVFPLVMHNKLNDVTMTRYIFFLIVSFASFLIMIVNELVNKVIYFKNQKYTVKDVFGNVKTINIIQKIKKLDLWVGIIIVFIIFSLITYHFSLYKNVSLWGIGGRYTGVIFMLACASIYIVISKCYIFEKKDLIFILCSTLVVNIWAVLNYAGFDPFNLLIDVNKNNKVIFISTLGNIDVYGAYACLMLSVSMYAFVSIDDIIQRIFYGIVAFSGMMGILACNSDMAVAGMFFAFAVLVYVAAYDIDKSKRYFILAAMVFVAGRILGLIYIINTKNTRVIRGVGRIIIYKNEFTIFFIVCCIMYFIMDYVQRRWALFDNKKLLDKLRNSYIFICIGVAFVLVVMCIINTVSQSGPLYLADDWGSGRGYIWKNSMEGYSNLPFINKIFGSGQATTAYVLRDYATIHTNIWSRSRIDNVHNIWLNILMNMGIAGLLSYISLIGLAVYNSLRYMKIEERHKLKYNKSQSQCLVAAFGLGVIIYSIQGSAELFETLTFPMFFCALAMLNNNLKFNIRN